VPVGDGGANAPPSTLVDDAAASAPATPDTEAPPSRRPYVNSRVERNEDARLLTGRARFVDDVQLPGMLHVAFVRSDYAHGTLTRVDVSAARQRAGVIAVYTAEDLGDYCKPAPLLVPPPPIPNLIFHACTHLPLARGKVRHVGEPVAMIVAESRYIAEDAVRDVVVDIEPLDAVVDLEAALARGCAARPRAPHLERRRTRRAAEGRLRGGTRPGGCRHHPAFPLRSRRIRGD
jgi:CO/xanthine dehydrogenase Mo-binding subunit